MQMINPGSANSFRSGRLSPAVEYLQGQRARSMMMAKLAEATAEIDVYLVPANQGGGGGGAGRGAVPTDGAAGTPPAGGGRRGPGGGPTPSVVGPPFRMSKPSS